MTSKTTGVTAVVGEALAAVAETTDHQPCLPLSGDVDGADDPWGVGTGPLDAELAGLRGEGRGKRGRGRPKGAKNRTTDQWVNVLLSSRRSPLAILLDVVNMPVAELAKALQCTVSAAFDRQVEAAKAVLPYLHQRLPQAIQLDATVKLPMLVLADPAQITIQQNQQLSDLTAVVLDSAELDNDMQTIETTELFSSSQTDLKSVGNGDCEAFARVGVAVQQGVGDTPPPPRDGGAGLPLSPSPEEFSPFETGEEKNPPSPEAGSGNGSGRAGA